MFISISLCSEVDSEFCDNDDYSIVLYLIRLQIEWHAQTDEESSCFESGVGDLSVSDLWNYHTEKIVGQ